MENVRHRKSSFTGLEEDNAWRVRGIWMDYEKLKSDCSWIILKKKNSEKERSNEYNIYKILRVTHNEVSMCRVLADFLNPMGKHGMGQLYLERFLIDVAGVSLPYKDLRKVRVYNEYLIENDRRIDIVIRCRDIFIPVEVKINACDRKSQCYDYYHYARRYDDKAFVIYLTKDGRFPSEQSVCGGSDNADRVPQEGIKCRSFSGDIIRWLDWCIDNSKENMKYMLSQYRDAIRDFTDNSEEVYFMELAKELTANSDNLRTALEVAGAIDKAKSTVMIRMFQEFERQMQPICEKYGLIEEERSRWYHYTEQATEAFYARLASTYPGINYVLKDAKIGHGLSLWLRIEVEYHLFAGFCVFDYDLKSETGVGEQKDEISDELWNDIKGFITVDSNNTSEGWWVDWTYLPTGSKSKGDDIDAIPEFKIMNEAAIALADDNYCVEFVRNCIRVLEERLLLRIK